MGVQTDRVVLIRYTTAGERRVGSGFRLRDRFVLTADHCAEGAGHQVELVDGTRFPATVYVRSNTTDVDLAVLEVDGAIPRVVGLGPARVRRDVADQVLGCQALGFPRWRRSEGRDRIMVQVDGYIPTAEGIRPVSADHALPDLLELKGTGPAIREHPTPSGELAQASPWGGMSGAAVVTHNMLVGVVRSHNIGAGGMSLTVTPLEAITHLDPAVAGHFMDATGLVPVEEWPLLPDRIGPMFRRVLDHVDSSGRPWLVGDADLEVFGCRRARTDIDLHGNPYHPYVMRDLDRDLGAALSRRVEGTERRVLLLVGEAMTGKSRTLAHALQSRPDLSTWPLLVPTYAADLQEVAGLAPATGAVLWLDDVNLYARGLSHGVVRYWQNRPGLVVLATLRADVLAALRADLETRPALRVVEDETLVEQFVLPVEFSDSEQLALVGADPLVRVKVAEGIPLGEVLGAAEELRKRLSEAAPFERAVAYTVIDWVRLGLYSGIAEAQVEEIWNAYLSRRDQAMVSGDSEERHLEFVRALRAVMKPIPFTATRLVTRDNERRLHAEDYLVAQRERSVAPVPEVVLRAALSTAQGADDTDAISLIAFTAFLSNVHDVARAGWQRLFAAGNANPQDSTLLGLVLQFQGDLAGARAAYRAAIDSGDPEQAPQASVNLGLLLQDEGDVAMAQAAFQAAIDSRHPHWGPEAEYRLGCLLEEKGDVAGACAAYRATIDSNLADRAPAAQLGLGRLLHDQGDEAGARAAYQAAVDSGDSDYGPPAAFNLGLLLADEGDQAGARAAYQAAVDSGDAEAAPRAALNLGWLLVELGDALGARSAFQTAVDSGDAEVSLRGALKLGELLGELGDAAGALAAYQTAVDSGHGAQAPGYAIELGTRLDEQGDAARARAAYRAAIDSGDPDEAPRAELALGALLHEQGDAVGARNAYQAVLDSGHAEWSPVAAFVLGVLLDEQGDVAGAKAAYQAAIDSGDPDEGPLAAVNLGWLLAQQGDLAGARAAYQTALDSGHPNAAPWAELLLGEQETDLDARKARRERAAVSGDDELLVSLAELYIADGDVEMARTLLIRASQGSDEARSYLDLLADDPGVADATFTVLATAAEAGDTDSMNFLGLHAYRSGDEDDARSWWNRSVDEGDRIARSLLGRLSTGD
jgi:TolA-binding protein